MYGYFVYCMCLDLFFIFGEFSPWDIYQSITQIMLLGMAFGAFCSTRNKLIYLGNAYIRLLTTRSSLVHRSFSLAIIYICSQLVVCNFSRDRIELMGPNLNSFKNYEMKTEVNLLEMVGIVLNFESFVCSARTYLYICFPNSNRPAVSRSLSADNCLGRPSLQGSKDLMHSHRKTILPISLTPYVSSNTQLTFLFLLGNVLQTLAQRVKSRCPWKKSVGSIEVCRLDPQPTK